MAQTIAKDVVLTDGGTGSATTEIEIPAENFKPRSSNDITSFARPKSGGGAPERRALNLNRIKTAMTVKAKVDDAFADKNHNGSGNRPDLANKEDWMLELWNLYTSVTHLELKATNDQTHPEISEFTGYIHNIDWNERGDQDNSVYEVTIKFQNEVPMNS